MSVDDRRAALVEAALTVMARDGVSATTTRAICAEAGMPQSAFHYAFRSKEELVHLAAKSVLDSTLPAPASDSDDLPLREIVGRALDRFWAATVTDPGRQAVVYELTLLDRRDETDPGALGRWQYDSYRRRVRAFLDAAATATGARWRVDTDALAAMVSAAIDGAVLSWLATDDEKTALASLATLADAVTALADVPEPVSARSRPAGVSARTP